MPVTQELLTKIDEYKKSGYTDEEIVQGLIKSPNYQDVSVKIKSYLNAGETPDRIVMGLRQSMSTPTVATQSAATPTQPSEPSMLGTMASEAYKFVTTPEKIGRLTFQGLGATAGTMLGGGATSLVTGPLGFAVGDQLADIVWGERLPPEKAGKPSEQIKQAFRDTLEGFKYETLGKSMEIGGRALYGLEKAAPEMAKRALKGEPILGVKKKATELYERGAVWVDKYAKKQAAKRVEAMKSTTPGIQAQVPINEAEAKRLEQAIPGFKFNLGQTTGDPNLLSLARAKSQQAGLGTSMSNEQIMVQNEALTNYVDTVITKGGNVSDFLKQVERVKAAVEAATGVTRQRAEREALAITGREADVIGRELLGKVRTAKAADTKYAEKLYRDVPDELKIGTEPLSNKIKELFGSFDELTQRLGTMPTGMMNRVKQAMAPNLTPQQVKLLKDIEAMKARGADVSHLVGKKDLAMLKEIQNLPKELTVKQLRDFKSQVEYAQRAAIAAKDWELAYNLGQLKYGVNDTFSEAAATGTGVGFDKLRKASDFWKNVFIPKYRHGATGEILGVKQTSEQIVKDSQIGAKYFKPGAGAEEAAASFKTTFGNDPEAKQLIIDYASQSLLKRGRNPVTGELDSKRIAQWLYSHKTALERHGIRNEFSSLESAMAMADKAKYIEAEFNKQALAKALNVNPDRAISQALFTGVGRKDSVRKLQEMVTLAAQDKTGAATAGLKAAIGDYLQSYVRVTTTDLAKNKLISYAKLDKFMNEFKPAFRQSGLYTNEELQAFDNVHSAVRAIAQQQRPHPDFGGSQTAELLTRIGASAVSIGAGHIGLYGATTALLRVLESPIKNKIEASLIRATFDPRHADNIRKLLIDLKKFPIDVAQRRFSERLTTLGAMTLGEMKKDYGSTERGGRATGYTYNPETGELTQQ